MLRIHLQSERLEDRLRSQPYWDASSVRARLLDRDQSRGRGCIAGAAALIPTNALPAAPHTSGSKVSAPVVVSGHDAIEKQTRLSLLLLLDLADAVNATPALASSPGVRFLAGNLPLSGLGRQSVLRRSTCISASTHICRASGPQTPPPNPMREKGKSTLTSPHR